VDGLVEDGILKRVRAKSIDLIVMTTHGRGPFSRFWLGSAAVEIVRHGPAPVLLVRPQQAPQDLGPKPTLRRILIRMALSCLLSARNLVYDARAVLDKLRGVR
jgi:hypothetical protein